MNLTRFWTKKGKPRLAWHVNSTLHWATLHVPFILRTSWLNIFFFFLPGFKTRFQNFFLAQQLTVSSISFTNCWEIVTWRLLLGGALVPLCGSVIGVLTTAIFRQRLPQVNFLLFLFFLGTLKESTQSISSLQKSF